MKKKLIEVALPLEAINKESAREKSIRHGHPSTLHLWWSRKPLATCRAVLFCSRVYRFTKTYSFENVCDTLGPWRASPSVRGWL
jgi:adenine-specific DNA methylase